ncbi:hypothetical protein QQS21_012771 [Conoideocrella luteorostrata]|uniref:Cell wall proline rich protein n=1 Tax=Conoideocrella luteorostrata TaxID=1105319 RepID=A0AAJ0CDA2_9HYPO|nr:hypothetical protein QQS21_012771 [Conoideocrella luteorostrata]
MGCTANAAASRSPLHAFDQSLDELAAVNPATSDVLGQDVSCPVEPRLPNPPFVFPALPASPPGSSSRPRRRPISMIDIQSRSPDTPPVAEIEKSHRPAALPQFSFNPGASIPADPDSIVLSPPITPNSARTVPSPSRPAGHGHRRGGSEFVGGSIRDGNSIAIMSTSPTKSESGFTSPGLQPPRRGHRRGVSGAISTNDLPLLHPQPDFMMTKGSSAPNSPTTFNPSEGVPLPLDYQPPPLPEPANPVPSQTLNDTLENTINNHSILVPTSPPRIEPSPRQSRLGRTRVGFSDTLEFIPRPLSLVSNDTSSTVTARPGHSVSGSISSIVSAASPGDRDSPATLTRSPTRERIDARPSTAGAILERTTDFKCAGGESTSPRRRNSIPTLLDSAKSDSANTGTQSPTKTPKRWSFFGLDPFIGSAPSSKHRSCSSSSSDSISKPVSGASSSEHESDSSEDEGTTEDLPGSKKDQKRSSRKKRVKGWAGSILPIRSSKKRSKMHAVRPPTPPASVGPGEDDEDENDEVEVPESEMPPATPTIIVAESQPLEEASSPKCSSDEESAYPMIDLDAALGPFNTPLPHNPEWDAAQRAAGSTGRRRLHSAQVMKGFSGPGMHYHRRAESAPDLPPFDAGRAGIHRFGSSSTMADVFEEDEEDDGEARSEQPGDEFNEFQAVESGDSDGEATPPAAITTSKKVSAETAKDDAMNEASMRTELRQSSYGASSTDHLAAAQSVRTECSKTSLREEVIVEDSPSIIFRSASVFTGLPIDQQDSTSSSPRLPPGGHRDLSPVEIVQGIPLNNTTTMPVSPYSTSHASPYPSPRSPMSIDAQRISTAPSSVTDENSFHSLLMGEPGPEVRISVDYDIPSLTSSNSTMTRESAFVPSARMSQPSLREQRPVSVSSAAFGRRRSSLVSLSRLISSSHGERSKLSMEVTLDNDAEGKRSRSKNSKTRRLGRMMQFWKPSKDSGPA